MSCKKQSDHQKFLKQWKEANITLSSSLEVRKNWLKHASVAWNAAKKIKEAEKEKRAKEHATACKLKATTSPKAVGTPLRVSTANTASSLGLSPVSLPERSARSLQQCRLNLNTQAAILAKRNSTLCGKVCGLQQPSIPVPPVRMSLPSARAIESDEDLFAKKLLASGNAKDLTKAKKIYNSLETKERRDAFLNGKKKSQNNLALQLEALQKEKSRNAEMQLVPYGSFGSRRNEDDVRRKAEQIYLDDDDEEKQQFYKDFILSGKSRLETDRLWAKREARLANMLGDDDELITDFRMRNAPRRFRFF